jgi:hypothetical protein
MTLISNTQTWNPFTRDRFPNIHDTEKAPPEPLSNAQEQTNRKVLSNTMWAAAFGAAAVASNFLSKHIIENLEARITISTLAAVGGSMILNYPSPSFFLKPLAILSSTALGAASVLATCPQGLIQKAAQATFRVSGAGFLEVGGAILGAAGTTAGVLIPFLGIEMIKCSGLIKWPRPDQTFAQKSKSIGKLILGVSAGTVAIGIGAGQAGSMVSTVQKVFNALWDLDTKNLFWGDLGTAAGMFGAAALAQASQKSWAGLGLLTALIGFGKGGAVPIVVLAGNRLLQVRNYTQKDRQNICSGIIVGAATAVMGGLTQIAAFAASSMIAGCVSGCLSALRKPED